MDVFDELEHFCMPTTWLIHVIEEDMRFTEELGNLQFQTFMQLQIVSKFLIGNCHGSIYFTNMIFE